MPAAAPPKASKRRRAESAERAVAVQVPESSSQPLSGTSKAEQEKLDRELDELLAETRVVLPGVTVLFAFLLTLPFVSNFQLAHARDRGAYFMAFISAALAMVLLIAQSAYHRLRGKPYDKARMLRTFTRQAISAIALLAIAMTSVVFLVTDMVYGGNAALPLAAAMFAFCLALWFGLPLARRLRGDG